MGSDQEEELDLELCPQISKTVALLFLLVSKLFYFSTLLANDTVSSETNTLKK